MAEAVGYAAIDCAQRGRSPKHSLVLKHDRLFMLVDPHGDIAPARALLARPLPRRHPDPEPLRAVGARRAARPALGPGPRRLRRADRPRGQATCRSAATAGIPGTWSTSGASWSLADRLVERVTLTSYLGTPLDYWIELALGCDFADIFEVRGWRRRERGAVLRARAGGRRAASSRYRGRDGRLLRTRGPVPPAARPAHRAERAMEPSRSRSSSRVELEWEVYADEGGTGASYRGRGARRRAQRRWSRVYRGWHEAEQPLDHRRRQLRRRAPPRDRRPPGPLHRGRRREGDLGRHPVVLHRLRPRLDHHLARRRCRSARGSRCDTLRYLARRQGEREDPFTEEQPGKILHELRRGEMARSGEIPHVPYFGTVDATPLWLVLLHETWRWTGDDGAGAGAPAQRRTRAGVDRPLRRPGRRRLRGVRADVGARAW